MALYLYQVAYTPESLAAQIKAPQDRLAAVAKMVEPAGVKLVGGGYTFGDYDLMALLDAPDDTTMAAFALALGAGGALKASKTTKLLSGAEWVAALTKAQTIAQSYQPAR